MAEQPERALHIHLDLRVRGGELEGRAAADGRPECAFCGWLELLAALDALISGGEA